MGTWLFCPGSGLVLGCLSPGSGLPSQATQLPLWLIRENHADTAATCLEDVAQDFEGPGMVHSPFRLLPVQPSPMVMQHGSLVLGREMRPPDTQALKSEAHLLLKH